VRTGEFVFLQRYLVQGVAETGIKADLAHLPVTSARIWRFSSMSASQSWRCDLHGDRISRRTV
jgi:hypothetical protein